jgi:hypothetical protein
LLDDTTMTWFGLRARRASLHTRSKLLNLDKTETPVLLQYALAQALTAVPHLVLEALDGKPYLLPKPMAF